MPVVCTAPRAPLRSFAGRRTYRGRAGRLAAGSLESLDTSDAFAKGGVLGNFEDKEALPVDLDLSNVFGYKRNFAETFQVLDTLGAGSFGVVSLVKDKNTGVEYAAKRVPKNSRRGPTTARYLRKLRTEVDVMRQMGTSLNAVYLHDTFEEKDHVTLVMEACRGGELWERVAVDTYDEVHACRYVRDILRFVAQAHANGILYRDIKPDNFLFLDGSEFSPLKATDFGLSCRIFPGQDDEKLSQRCGTPAYMAPEVVLQSYDKSADLWSVGMVAYQLLTGRFCFWEDVRGMSLREVWKSVLHDKIQFQHLEEVASPEAVALVKGLLTRDVEGRMSAEEALRQPWFKRLEEGGNASSNDNDAFKGTLVQRLQRYGAYGLLKQRALALLAADAAAADEELGALLQNSFDSADLDSSGTLEAEELATALRRAGYAVTDAEVGQMLQFTDIDFSGSISYDEFLATTLDWQKIAERKGAEGWKDMCRRAFNLIDTDGSGYLELDEVVSLLPEKFMGGRHAFARDIIAKADRNGDGRIDFEEFESLLNFNGAAVESLDLYDSRQISNEALLAESE